MSHSSTSTKPIPVKESDVEIKVHVDYAEAARMLEVHPQLFFANMNAKQAYYARKRLEHLCKCKIESHQAIYSELKQEGYVFHKLGKGS